MARKKPILVYFSQTGEKQLIKDSAHGTWGELMAAYPDLKTKVSTKTCVLSGSRHVLAMDEAELPEGSTDKADEYAFTIYVFPKESKGGAKKAAKKVKKVAKVKKAAKKAPAKKKAKSTKKKASSAVADVLSSVEKHKLESDEKMRAESEEIQRKLKDFR